MYSFGSIVTGIDVDMMGMLKRKGFEILYLVRKGILTELKESFSRRVK